VDQAEASTATATTTILGTATTKHLLTGTVGVTGFTGTAGVTYHCRAEEAFTLTHHATNLIITQGAESVTTAAGDTFDVQMITGTACRIVNYQRAANKPVNLGTASTKNTGTEADEVPLNSDLGTAATKDIGTSGPNVPLLSNLNSWGAQQTVNGSVTSSTGNVVSRSSGNRHYWFYTEDGLETGLVYSNATNKSLVMRHKSTPGGETTNELILGPTAGELKLNGSQVPLKIFESAEQSTYALNSILTVAHGLGVRPRFAFVRLRCISAEHEYNVGDETDGMYYDGTVSGPLVVTADATNLYYMYGNTYPRVVKKSADEYADWVNINNLKWRFVFRAIL
jgi:hypothetical protein